MLNAINEQFKELGWVKEETCENLSEYDQVDQFECSNCGIVIGQYVQIEVDEDDPDDEYHCEYRPRYCPNCGRKIID